MTCMSMGHEGLFELFSQALPIVTHVQSSLQENYGVGALFCFPNSETLECSSSGAEKD